jgi:hypothetical protein
MKTFFQQNMKPVEQMYDMILAWFFSLMTVGVSGIMQWRIKSEVAKSIIALGAIAIIAFITYDLTISGNFKILEIIKLIWSSRFKVPT